MKNETTAVDARSEQMLRLLAGGASIRVLAKELGYREGTMRVYLHNLYRKIGVANKTEAVIWYLKRGDGHPAPVAEAFARASAAQAPESTGDLVGDMALHDNLFIALGVMGTLVGPHALLWEVGLRMKGQPLDEAARGRRDRSRRLWRSLLEGDFGYAKRLHDADGAAQLLLDSPADAVVLCAMLFLGGYTQAADRLASQLSDKRKGGPALAVREANLIRALREDLHRDHGQVEPALHHLATEKAASPVLRQLAVALLFQLYACRRDAARARQAANALWVEAEATRRQLEAMGERPFAAKATLGHPQKAEGRRSGAREKATAR